ncbi:hypothetical protein L9F63_006941 [Diploptera punctata]|uniref:Proline dehydrogenase n=1 Tax=Diploptera punctata TaxID=6984 RepID=A0AAD8E3S3_DIPPU|nr:hypothetical protein L9F63_006941 [Diploptera punctata]
MVSGCSKLLRCAVASGCCNYRHSSHASINTIKPTYEASPCTLEFDDHRTVFQHKSTWQLFRALIVLRACASDYLVDNSLKLLRQGRKLLGERMLGWLLHPTVYLQFVAGKSGSDLAVTAELLRKLNIRLMVAPTLEEDVGESSTSQEKYDKNLQEMLRLADMTHCYGGTQPCLQTKITAMVSADTLSNLTRACANEKLETCTKMVEHIASAMTGGKDVEDIGVNHTDRHNITLALRRLRLLGEVATSKNLRLLVDAEYSYMNPGCSLLTLAMMTVFNQQRPVVSNTYQCYFKRAMQMITHELDILNKLGACFGVKLVRGAYLEKERRLDPTSVCESHYNTGQNYQKVLERALLHVLEAGPERSLLIMATHNEDAVRHAVSRIQQLGLDTAAGHVVFAQIYGMAEQISLPLAKAGYIVYKSVPVGSLSQVLPYLARRAAENRSVLHGARKERELLQQELFWRFRNVLKI